MSTNVMSTAIPEEIDLEKGISNHSLDAELWDSITCLRHEYHDVYGISKIIYLASYKPVQPRNDPESFDRLKAFLNYLNIGSILNTSIDRQLSPHHLSFYEDVEITYQEHLIKDDVINGFPEGYLEKCLDIFLNLPFDKPVVIHCSAGQNRSAAAAAAILWATTPHPRPWNSPEEMIDWMRDCQVRDRRIRLLKNPVFYAQVVEWCQNYDN